MARVKGGPNRRRRYRKIIALTRGHRGGRHHNFRQAHESLLHALAYSYRHRRERKGQFRRLWIERINAAARMHGISYSRLIRGLNHAGVELDRKHLADLAVRDSATFAKIVETAKSATAN